MRKQSSINPELPPAAPTARPKLRRDSGAIVLCIAIAALYFTREILIPFAFALILTFLLTPAVTFLRKLHAGRVLSVLATCVISIMVAAAVAWVIASQLLDVADQLPLYRQNIHAKIEAFHIPVNGQLGHAAASVKEIVREVTSPTTPSSAPPPQRRNQKQLNTPPGQTPPVPVQMVEPPTNGWTEFRDLGLPILVPLGRAGIVVIFTIFMLLEREELRNRLLSWSGSVN